MAGVVRTYAHDGDGLLASRSGPPLPTTFRDSASSPARLLQVGSDRIVHGLAPLYAATPAGTTSTFARDGLGSVRAEVTDLGLVTGSFRYRAYGETAQSSGTGPTYLGYAGQLVDPSGLLYMRARWYDPATGRFLTRDPMHGAASSPASLNAYLYALANPQLLADPSGMCVPHPVLAAICGLLQRAVAFIQRVPAIAGRAVPAAQRAEEIAERSAYELAAEGGFD